ncbi:hypothetical protein FACHB389_28695 [Nostoc calcicola FACHB-389]|nr:hypothetical protein FACHB389_28695 [Nostoc calcicola FACHB-389]
MALVDDVQFEECLAEVTLLNCKPLLCIPMNGIINYKFSFLLFGFFSKKFCKIDQPVARFLMP